MSYLWITLEIVGGLVIGFLSTGYMLEQVFSVMYNGREGRWGMLLAGLLVVAVLVTAAIYSSFYASLWSSLVATCVLVGIVIYQKIKYGRLADEFRSNHQD